MMAWSTADRRWMLATVALAALLAALAALFLAGTVYTAAEECWGADAGRHYLEGQRIGLALRHFDIGGAAAYLMERNHWPPLHVMAIAIVVAVGGADFRAASLISLATWVVAVTLTAGLVFRLWRVGRTTSCDTARDRTVGVAAALLAAAWFGSTPLLLEYSFLPMQEVPTMMLLMLALTVWLGMERHRELGESRSAARGAWALAIVTTAIGLTRYAVWVEWLLAWMVLEFTTFTRRDWSDLADALRRFLSRRAADRPSIWSSPALLLAAGVMALWVPTLILSRLSGGSITIAGKPFRLGVGGNLVYAALVLAVVGTIHLWVRHRRWCGDLYERLPDVWRALLVAHVAPMTVWFLFPPRMRILVKTFFGLREEQHRVMVNPLLMIRDDLFAVPWSAWLLVALVIASLGFWRQTSVTGRRFFWLALLIALPTASMPYERRYVLPALVPLIPLASVTLARLLAVTVPALVRSLLGRPLRGVGVAGMVVTIAASVAMISTIGLSLERVVGEGLPRPHHRRPRQTAARVRIVAAAGERSGPLLVLTNDPFQPESNIHAAFNERHQRVMPDVVGWIRLEGRDADTALAETLRALRPELIIAYRAAAVTRVDPDRIAILEALERRTDYVIIETVPGANDGDILELRAPAGGRPL